MDLKSPPTRITTARHTGAFAAGNALSMRATLKPLDPAPVKDVRLDTTHKIIEISPGVKFSCWTFGDQVLGPTIRACVGDKIRFTMTNRSDEPVLGVHVTAAPMMHSMDFHAVMVSPQDLSHRVSRPTPARREARRRGGPTPRSPRSKASSLTLSAPVRAQKTDGARGTLYTIGHSTRSTRDLVDLLRAHGVEQVVDVRTIPKSRHNPQFNRPALTRSLHLAKIGYRHMKALGGLRHARLDSINLGWRNASFRGYADYMQSEDFVAGLARLEQLAARRPTAIMCAEAVPWRCHRSLIADALTVARWRVLHIESRHTARPHKRTTFLRVRSGRLLYPVPRESSRIDTESLRADPRTHRG